MSLIPGDLVTDADLLALDSAVLTDFGATSLQLVEKRRIAVVDWLRPRLEQANYAPDRHMTKRAPDVAWAKTGAAWTDQRAAFADPADHAVNTLLATPATDALYIGMRDPFRGLWIALTDTVNANSLAVAVTYWNGTWKAPTSLADGTAIAGVPLAAGGRLTWALPDDWIRRSVNGSMAYWVRYQVGSPLTTPTLLQQILPIARSRLTYPVAQYALGLIYREGIANSRGDWKEKAQIFIDAAEKNLTMALSLDALADEFDVDADDAVSRLEQNSVTTDPWIWERG